MSIPDRYCFVWCVCAIGHKSLMTTNQIPSLLFWIEIQIMHAVTALVLTADRPPVWTQAAQGPVMQISENRSVF